MFPRLTLDFSDGLSKRDPLRARVHAVLRVGAFLDAAGSHDRREPLALIHRSRGVHIKKAHLADNGRADELIILVHLRANLEAVSAGNAIRKRIAFFLNFGRYARSFAEIVSAVDGNPGLYALEAVKHTLPIDREIAHPPTLGHGVDANRLLELIHQRRTRHARFLI